MSNSDASSPSPAAQPASEVPAQRYTAALAEQIETAWQQRWADEGTFRTPDPDPGVDAATAKKFYLLDMFPYPSGKGLHVGHPLGYIATDAGRPLQAHDRPPRPARPLL